MMDIPMSVLPPSVIPLSKLKKCEKKAGIAAQKRKEQMLDDDGTIMDLPTYGTLYKKVLEQCMTKGTLPGLGPGQPQHRARRTRARRSRARRTRARRTRARRTRTRRTRTRRSRARRSRRSRR